MPGNRQRRDNLDPITVEVVRNKLEGIANEMQSVLLRSSFSPIVKEGLDASACLFTAEGETLAQATAIPIHLATLIPVIRVIRERFPTGAMAKGDIFMMNDPYLGGTHLPDIAVVMPVFHDDAILGFSAAMVHHQDVGGMTPGSVPTNAESVYQEGLRIPPLKLVEAGKIDEKLFALICQNVRMPDAFTGDINAQISACKTGAKRLKTIADKFGGTTTLAIAARLLDKSEAMTRTALQQIPDGRYRYEDYLDNDGIELETPIKIAVTAIVEGDSITFDLTGTSGQVKGPFNCVPSGSMAAACFAVKALTGSDIPANGGCFRPIRLILPEGSIVNPVEPAPVNARTSTIKRITGCMISAFQQALPAHVPADGAGEMLILQFGGETADKRKFVVGELIAGGSGASADADGVDVIETDATNCMNLPVEALELEAPIRVLQTSLRQDSGGTGAHRGGLGLSRDYLILSGDITFTHRGERHVAAARGYGGGGDGAKAVSIIHRADGREEEIPSKTVTHLYGGDRLSIRTAGGGGYGDAQNRDPERIADDLRNGKISEASAQPAQRPLANSIKA